MFRFRLQTLLRIRIADRDQRRAELAKALRAEALLRDRQEGLEAEQVSLAGRERELKSPGVADVDALLHAHRYEIVLATQMRQLNDQLAQVVAESERRRQALVEADRQVRVLEKLRDRQSAAHRHEEQRLETREFDELALVGYSRRREVRP